MGIIPKTSEELCEMLRIDITPDYVLRTHRQFEAMSELETKMKKYKIGRFKDDK